MKQEREKWLPNAKEKNKSSGFIKSTQTFLSFKVILVGMKNDMRFHSQVIKHKQNAAFLNTQEEEIFCSVQ